MYVDEALKTKSAYYYTHLQVDQWRTGVITHVVSLGNSDLFFDILVARLLQNSSREFLFNVRDSGEDLQRETQLIWVFPKT